MPILLIEQPVKRATPATADRVWPPAQARAAPVVPVPDAIARVTVAVLVATVLPLASWTVTAGWTASGVP